MESGMQQTGVSRRGVVKGAAGAAAVGAVTLASPRTAQAETAPAPARPGARGPVHPVIEETMTVHVRDARAGLLDIYVGERHVQVRDKDLAARLIAAAR
ncbi:hypothetical protein ABH920_006989 [Catenulispora sp. EB89]|uniref:twin-arginine translocation signal domain-containing protein n=1 Tax=Catenulispora sp. EB89 TaxID=3156257 RepID=UPI003519A07F